MTGAHVVWHQSHHPRARHGDLRQPLDLADRGARARLAEANPEDAAARLGLQAIGDLFPIKHLYQALLAAFDPASAAPASSRSTLRSSPPWGVAGFAIALGTFRWAPRTTS
jgi:hypothetical protein